MLAVPEGVAEDYVWFAQDKIVYVITNLLRTGFEGEGEASGHSVEDALHSVVGNALISVVGDALHVVVGDKLRGVIEISLTMFGETGGNLRLRLINMG